MAMSSVLNRMSAWFPPRSQDDRLEIVLRDVADAAGTGRLVFASAIRPVAPGHHARELLPGEGRCVHLSSDEMLRHCLSSDAILDPEVAEDLHGALISDVGARGIGRARVLGHGNGADPGSPKERRGSEAGRPGTDYQYFSVKC